MIPWFTDSTSPLQLKPEMERYEWVVIHHPELASAIRPADLDDPAAADSPSADQSLQEPDKPPGELSPFLATRHFNLNSKNTSMFMAGNFDSIIVGEQIASDPASFKPNCDGAGVALKMDCGVDQLSCTNTILFIYINLVFCSRLIS